VRAQPGSTALLKTFGQRRANAKASRPYSDPEAAARQRIELAKAVEAVQDSRIHIELLYGPMLFGLKATPAKYSAGLKFAIERGWLVMHESGAYVKFIRAAAEEYRFRSVELSACVNRAGHPRSCLMAPIKTTSTWSWMISAGSAASGGKPTNTPVWKASSGIC
jgi:hypothetical protein